MRKKKNGQWEEKRVEANGRKRRENEEIKDEKK